LQELLLNEAVNGPEFAELLVALVVLPLPLNGRVQLFAMLFPECSQFRVGKGSS